MYSLVQLEYLKCNLYHFSLFLMVIFNHQTLFLCFPAFMPFACTFSIPWDRCEANSIKQLVRFFLLPPPNYYVLLPPLSCPLKAWQPFRASRDFPTNPTFIPYLSKRSPLFFFDILKKEEKKASFILDFLEPSIGLSRRISSTVQPIDQNGCMC